jgi:glycosyltransferase involved in cell wall biosynthesis
VFNAANSPFLPLVRRRRTRVAIHVDGLESRRSKWGGAGRRYYRAAEALSVRWGDALIADAAAIGHYYAEEFGATTEMIAYGAPLLEPVDTDGLDRFGVEPGRYHLVVARFEPENHVDVIVRGFRQSAAAWPLLVVGGAPYAQGYIADVHDAATGDDRIKLIGPVWDQELLDKLYFHCATYLHGHSVGGTNPSLLRAMGAGAAVIAYDVVFTREVLAEAGEFFADEASLGTAVEAAERDPDRSRRRGAVGRDRVAAHYRWDDVADAYERLAGRVVAGSTRRREVSGRRRPGSSWASGATPR